MPARRDQFLLQYVNQPAWTEPLRMIAGEIGAAATVDPSALGAGRVLVELAERADPVFASSLAYEFGPNVWRAAGASLAKTLRGLYRSQDAHARKLAVAGMLASGSEEFGDILLPLGKDSRHLRTGNGRDLRWNISASSPRRYSRTEKNAPCRIHGTY
jgi:hypothetical protein